MNAPTSSLGRSVLHALGETPGEPGRAACIVERQASEGEPDAQAAMALAWADWFERFAGVVANASSADADAAFAGLLGAVRRLARGGETDLDAWRSSCRATATPLLCRYDDGDAVAAAYVLRATGATSPDELPGFIYREGGPRALAMKGVDGRAFQWRVIAYATGQPCPPMPRLIAPHRLAAQALGEACDVDHLERRVAAEQRAIKRGWRETRAEEPRS